ncbi:hypothetical protein K439DRAFT_1620221 [Ramaria rubella]|nr:hypothetical protein K439DRAFT_1620221 [Ramaria rubella]
MAHLHRTYDRVYYDTRELARLHLDLQEHGDKLKPATIEHDIQLDLDEHHPSKKYSLCDTVTSRKVAPMLASIPQSSLQDHSDFPLDHIVYFELHMIFCNFCEQAHNTIQALTRTDVTPAPSTPLKPMSQALPSKVKDLKVKPGSVPKSDNGHHTYGTRSKDKHDKTSTASIPHTTSVPKDKPKPATPLKASASKSSTSAPASQSQPNATVIVKLQPGDLRTLEELLMCRRPWPIMHSIIALWPHPSHKIHWENVISLSVPKARLMLSKLYHPDKNLGEGPWSAWYKTCEQIQSALNGLS